MAKPRSDDSCLSVPSLLIVVPTLDSHELLPRLLASLQAQTWSHWQVLFVDGPSGPDHRRWLAQCCAREPRCRWMVQGPDDPGIFGAMNHGFAAAAADQSDCWLLFWGSDDWAASPTVLAQTMSALQNLAVESRCPDLLICRGRYAESDGRLGRSTSFLRTHSHRGDSRDGRLAPGGYQRALFTGSTPPHQATLIGPGARGHRDRYASGFRLSADLDYFLQLGRVKDLDVQCLDLELVHMADGGVSGQQTRRRLQEVRRAYRNAYGWLWSLPFLFRYLRRLASALEVLR